MKFLIYGAGALGQGIGCMLAAAGHTVHLVLRPRFKKAILAVGLRVTGILGAFHVSPSGIWVHDALDDLIGESFDFAVVTTKAYDTYAAVSDLARLKDQRFNAVSMQNGCGNVEILSEMFGTERTLGARVITGFEISEPGTVRITVSADAVRVGGDREGTVPPSAQAFSDAVRESGLPCEPTAYLRQHLFAKLLYNCALNPLGAVLGVPYGTLGDNEHTRTIMDSIIRETFGVISAMGEKTLWNSAEEYMDAFYGTQIPATYHHRPSMLQDIEHGKPTEVDALTGWVTAKGRELGIETPVCELLSHLVRFRQSEASRRTADERPER